VQQGGTLSVASALTLYSKGSIVFSGGATTVAGGVSVRGGTLSFSGGSLTTQSLDVSSANSFGFSAGAISINGGGLYLRPSGATIGNGTSSAVLQLQNNAAIYAGPLTIANNSTLTGAGTGNTPVTVNPGGILAPGGPVGTMTFASGLVLNSSGSTHATLQMDLGGDPTIPADAGITFDQILMSGGAFTVGGATLQITALGNVVLEQPYPIVTTTGGSINFSSMFSNLTGGTSYNDGLLSYHVTYMSSEIDLYFDSVPEPGSVSLLALGTFGLMRRRRRRTS
jgi:hypothetical protein